MTMTRYFVEIDNPSYILYYKQEIYTRTLYDLLLYSIFCVKQAYLFIIFGACVFILTITFSWQVVRSLKQQMKILFSKQNYCSVLI